MFEELAKQAFRDATLIIAGIVVLLTAIAILEIWLQYRQINRRY